jgi:hypothetical protein
MGNEENKVINLTENDNWKNSLSVELVDQLADELIREYSNPQFRAWYCKLIYAFGPSRIKEWQGRVRDADNPAKLFSKLAAEALRAKEARERLNA